MTPPPDTNSEPSIEEILDSIRQIIADDDDSAAEAPANPVANALVPDEIIELKERVPAPPPPPQKKPIVVEMKEFEPEAEPPPVRTPAPEPRRAMTPPAPPEPDNLENILTRGAENATMEAFSELSQRSNIEKGGGITIEDVVRYEVRPLLRAWIDKYLPGIVERLLQKELEKISARVEQD